MLEEISVGCQFMNMQLILEEIYVVVCTFGLLSQDVIPFPPFVVKGRIKLSYAGIPGNRFPKSQKHLQGRTLKALKFLNTFSVFYN